uniref:Olfactory receptor 52K2-like n=1 Tax=Petromyzon marinus TaxID=7757 RepID=A0AAJ7UEQ4_PETMA|nr:olfactory receptor 52K2-like [Petromyzon marinus]
MSPPNATSLRGPLNATAWDPAPPAGPPAGVTAWESPWALAFMSSPFREPPSLRPLYVALFAAAHAAIVAGNSLLLAAILLDRRLHRPMFVLLANLAACDLLGSAATLPGYARYAAGADGVPLGACLAQMFAGHVYGAPLAGLSLASMAVDRALAVRLPLRYAALATNWRALRPVAMPHCDHFALVRMACDDAAGGDASVNRAYDLGVKAALLAGGAATVLASYALVATLGCGGARDGAERRGRGKALRTCVTHLMVFLVLQVSVVLLIAQNHIQRYLVDSVYLPAYLAINFHVVPPLLNPIIYGLRTVEIQHGVRKLFRRKVLPITH